MLFMKTCPPIILLCHAYTFLCLVLIFRCKSSLNINAIIVIQFLNQTINGIRDYAYSDIRITFMKPGDKLLK